MAQRKPRTSRAEELELPEFSLLKNNPLYQTPMDYLHTGNYLLNWAVSNDAGRGWPLGRVVELFGDPSTGKSLLAYQAMAAMQKRGGKALLDDVEHAFDPRFATIIGMDSELVMVRASRKLEDCFESISKAVDRLQGLGVEHAVFVLDSLGMLSSEHEEEVGFEKRDMTKASLIRQAMRMLLQRFATTRYLFIVLNHSTANIGDQFNPRTTPGGSGVKFAASVRVELKYAGKLPGKIPKGVLTRFKVAKNRVAPPFREGVLRVLFKSGVTEWSGVGEALLAAEVLSKDKAGLVSFHADKRYRLSTFDDNFPSIVADMGYEDPVEALNYFLANDGDTQQDTSTEDEE